MASDVSLLVVDPTLNVVVAVRWIGGNGAAEACRSILLREPTRYEVGYEVWQHVDPDEVVRIVEQGRYANGLTREETRVLAERHPPSLCWWSIERDD